MMKSLTIMKVDGKPGQVYYPLKLHDIPIPSPPEGHVLIRLHTTSLNHRDLFIRQHLYPAISFTNPLFADGYGTVVKLGPSSPSNLQGKKVLLMPCLGWDSSPEGPEEDSETAPFAVLGSSRIHPFGMGQEYITFPARYVVECPSHLTSHEAAALPLVGLTAWRALVSKSGNALPGRNILITGIGGGVALSALQFAVAKGCNVFVTSSSTDKIKRAVDMGAKGGVNYRTSPAWEKDLLTLLPAGRPYLDAVIDGAGGDIMARTGRVLKAGGVVAQYGMTMGPKMDWSMAAVLKNVELKGTSMGSMREFEEMVAFTGKEGIQPVVDRVVKGGLGNLEGIGGLFEVMKEGGQFGKLVVEIGGLEEGGEKETKL